MNTKTKKIISSLLIAANMAIPANITLAKEESMTHTEVKVYFNDEKIEFDQEPIIVNGRTKVPFRAIFETMGTIVYYRDSDNTVLGITRDGDTIYHKVGTNKATINGVEKTYDSVSEMRNYRTLVPVRMVADLLNAEVEWIEKTNTVEIEKEMLTNEYHKKIRGILGCSIDQNFNPEDFKRYMDYQYKNWNMDPKQVILNVNMDLDRELIEQPFTAYIPRKDYIWERSINGLSPRKEELTYVEDVDSKTVLVNKFNVLPYDYVPSNIQLLYKDDLSGSEFKLRADIVPNFLELNEAYKNYKLDPTNLSENRDNEMGLIVPKLAFVSRGFTKKYELDNNIIILNEQVRSKYYELTDDERFQYVFAHTFDDLQTGLSFEWYLVSVWDLEIYKKYLGYPLSEKEAYSLSIKEIIRGDKAWMRENAPKYGFIIRYPRGKEHITRMRATDAVYRYVGKDIAEIMINENLSLEEYCAKYESKTNYKTDIESTKKRVLQRY